MKYAFLILSFIITSINGRAQFAPQAGLTGSTAMHKDSSAFVDWASNCTVNRGWMNLTDTSLGKVTAGNPGKAFGKADADIVSLGDAGEAVFFFENPVINGNGYDFAVFENGFLNPLDSNLAYLELAKVDVSNDGITFYPFAAVCENDTTAQIAGVGEYMDARKLNNLAGKYVAGYGTPFDLDELSLQPGLNVNDIHYIKIKDIIGTLAESDCVKDINQRAINDPYPTPFPTGGFDLDAIGIIHQKYPTGLSDKHLADKISFYPNPTTGVLTCKNMTGIKEIGVYSPEGKLLIGQQRVSNILDISSLANGHYLVSILLTNGQRQTQLITKHE